MEEQKTQPSYYTNIPASVRYDKDIPANAKLLYGEIGCLSNKFGYCFASNNYFANLYDLSEDRISRLIHLLERKGYIEILLTRNEQNFIINRQIKLLDPGLSRKAEGNNNESDGKNTDGKTVKIPSSDVKNDKSNINTNNNKTLNNNTSSEEALKNLVKELEATLQKKEEEIKKLLANASSSKDSEKKTTEKKRYPKADYDEVYALHNKICKWLCDNNRLSSMPTYSYKVCNSVIKKAFDSFGKDKVLEGMKNAVKDRWCVEKSGFCITAILSEKVLFREINKQFYDPYQSNGRIEIKKGQSAFVDKERDFSNITNTEDIR